VKYGSLSWPNKRPGALAKPAHLFWPVTVLCVRFRLVKPHRNCCSRGCDQLPHRARPGRGNNL